MTEALTITWSSGTINLNDGTIFTLQEYTPRSGFVEDLTVQDTIRIKVAGTSTGAVGSALGSLEAALRYADEYTKRLAGSHVFLNYTPESYSSAYKSELLDACVFEYEQPYENNFIQNKAVFGDIQVNRRNYWLGPQTAGTVQNPNGTSDIVAVFNSNDGTVVAAGTRYAYVDIGNASIPGDLPAPTNIYYVNAAGTAMEKLWIFNQIYQGTAFNPNIEETKISLGTSIGTSAYSTYSNGTAKTFGIGTTMAVFAKATITPVSGYVPEQMLIMMASTSGATSTIQMRADLMNNGVVIQTGTPVQLSDDYLQGIDIFQLPPTTLLSTIEIWLYGKNTAGSSNLVIDNLWTMPLQGGYREYNIIGTTLGTSQPSGRAIYDFLGNDTNPVLYVDGGTAGYYYNVLAKGNNIYLQPNALNRLWFVREDADGRNPSSYGNVSIEFYPRRLKL